MKRLVWPVFAALCLAAPMLAYADSGYIIDNVNLRAGPDPSYPLIAQLDAGTEVDVQGCTDGWEWCDVVAYGNRGWIAGNYIQYEYDNQLVALPSYGAQFGIPIVGFSIGTYWNSYYRSRPFYSDRDSWYDRPYVRRGPPPPPHDFYHGQAGFDHPDGHDNGNYGNRHDQGYERPGSDRDDGHDDNRRPFGQGYERPAQPAPDQAGAGQNYQRPAAAPGNGYQRPGQPAQQAQPNGPRPTDNGRPMPAPGQMSRPANGQPANGQPAPAGNHPPPNDHPRGRDNNPRDDAARHDNSH